MLYENKARIVNCPICRQKEGLLLYSVNINDSVTHFKTTGWRNPNNPERLQNLKKAIFSLWKNDSCEVVRCRKCKFVFAHPYIAGDANFYNLAFDDAYPKNKWEFDKTIESIQAIPNFKELTIFEVGAGTGMFTKQLLQLGIPSSSLSVTEYSNQAIQSLSEIGITVYSEDIRVLTKQKILARNSIDVLCVFQVMEHMDNLHEFMQSINYVLKPGGKFFMAVPNPNRIEFNERNGGFLDMPPNHISRFSPESLAILANENGFSIVNQLSEPEPIASLMGSFFYQRAIRRLQLNIPNPGKLKSKIQFNHYRLIALSKGTPGEGYWIQMQKK
jgi:2-polyprenyl-3-methyl-5-hydroxy-6-metoxy-1,4-benzoquinol methylase